MSYYVDDSDDSDDCSVLLGPGNFRCTLGEPEDRTWYRDGSKVVDELNRLYDLVQELADSLYFEEKMGAITVGHPKVDPSKAAHAAMESLYGLRRVDGKWEFIK